MGCGGVLLLVLEEKIQIKACSKEMRPVFCCSKGLQSEMGWEVTGLAVPAPQAFQSKRGTKNRSNLSSGKRAAWPLPQGWGHCPGILDWFAKSSWGGGKLLQKYEIFISPFKVGGISVYASELYYRE